MWRFLHVALLLASLVIGYAQYNLKVLLQKYEVEDGKLEDGSYCDPFYFAGLGCRISLKICVEIEDPTSVDLDLCNGVNVTDVDEGYVWLGEVTKNENSVTFAEEEYKAWTNPHIIPVTEKISFKGFSLKVKAYQDADNVLIDSFVVSCTEEKGTISFNHSRDGTLSPTVLDFAWDVFELREPTTPPPSTTPRPAPTDCEDVRRYNEPSGVYKLAVGTSEFSVYCDIGGFSSYTVFQSRGDGDTFDFDDKKWDDYKTGFGTPGRTTNYWLGLDNLRTLIKNKNYGMTIDLCCGNVAQKSTFYANLDLDDEKGNYKLTGNSTQKIGLSADQGDGTTDFNAMFSTAEKWNGGDDLDYCDVINFPNVVTNGPGGWWFGVCGNNLNGHYYAANDPAFKDPATCQLNLTNADVKKYGTGIELRTTETFAEIAKQYFDGKSFTRARMALYRIDSNIPDDLSPFCD